VSSANQSGNVSVNKNAFYAVVLIVAIVTVVGAGYFLLKPSSSSTSNDVVITNFQKDSGYVSGPTTNEYFIYPFNVTITNRGSNTVGGLSVVVEILGNGNILGSSTTQIGTLQAGYQYSLGTDITFSGNSAAGETQSYVALLEMNGVVINQSNIGG
jgi:hypothetical protein